MSPYSGDRLVTDKCREMLKEDENEWRYGGIAGLCGSPWGLVCGYWSQLMKHPASGLICNRLPTFPTRGSIL